MNRRPIQVLLAATAAVLAVAAVSGAAAFARSRGAGTARAASTQPLAALTDLTCHHALDPRNRSVSSTALIRPVAGTAKEAVNFHLIRRTRGGTPESVSGPGLGGWLTKSFAGQPVDLWRVIHTVADLSAPASYRFSVSFRWIGSSGQILARATRASRSCHQPELRPNLEVVKITVGSDLANAAEDYYTAQIRDAGATGAGPFRVELSDQGQVDRHRVAHIDPHQTLSVRLAGPACSSTDPPTVTADPAHRVDVYSRAQASLTATCPAPTSPSGSTAGG
jgi:hypothetical protein